MNTKKFFRGMTDEEIIMLLCSDTAANIAKKLGCSRAIVQKCREKYGVIGYCGETICWHCKKACCGCSWSKRFVPVKGWTATETVIIGGRDGSERIKSYRVIRCPEFERG